MKIFITSDTHFGHKNIIDYSGRPFTRADGQPDVDQMNRHMTDAWNRVVGRNDVVIHVGDFAMGPPNRWREYRTYLRGHIILIRGNHDRRMSDWMESGDVCLDSLYTRDRVWIVHRPPIYDPFDRYGIKPVLPPKDTRLILCGHVHEKWKEASYIGTKVINVGVDVQGYEPIELDRLTQSD